MSALDGRGDARSRELKRAERFLGAPGERWRALLPLAALVGLLSGGSGALLRASVHALFDALGPLRTTLVAVVLPALGAVLGSALVTRVFREPSGHGVPDVIRAVCRRGGRMRARAMLSRWLGSMINVSAGGSAGLEGPIVYSGAAVGSALGRLARLDERRASVLLACGVAGGISGVFNAPMTGMIFAMEVVLAEWSAFAIVPVVVSAVAATELSRLALGNAQSFLHAPFEMRAIDLAACVLLGALAGVASLALTSAIESAHRLAGRVPRARLAAPALFGLAVGLIGLLAPEAIGEGYDAAQRAIRSELPAGLGLCALLLVAKVLATGLTLGSDAPGGVFAPCLVSGTFLGVAFARVLELVLPDSFPLAVEGSFALVGMCGMVAGVMQAPLTGIFLVMEVTGGYEVILPLMIVSVLSLVVVRRFRPYSLYTQELARSGELLRPGTDKRILADVALSETLDRDVTPVPEDLSLFEFARVVRGSRRNHFPVLRPGSEEFAGMLELGSVRALLLEPELARVTLVGTMMDAEPPTVQLDASLADALDAFEATGAWVLPVLEGKRFAGLVSKASIFDHYRRELSVQAPG